MGRTRAGRGGARVGHGREAGGAIVSGGSRVGHGREMGRAIVSGGQNLSRKGWS